MGDKPSYSVAPGDSARPRVLSLGALLALVSLSLLGLALVFPREDLFNRLRADSANTDPSLTVAYLRNIIRIESEDMDLRLLLAEKLAEQREFEQAAQVLKEAEAHLHNPQQRRGWEEAQALLLWRQYQITRADKPEAERAAFDAQMKPALLAQIGQLHQTSRLLFLVDQSIRLQNRDLMQALFERIAVLPNASFTELGQAARVALGQGLFDVSARLYFVARDKVGDSEARNRMVMLGVKSLLAAGEPVRAFEAAKAKLDHLGPQDPLRWDLVRMGLAAGRSRDLLEDLSRLMPAGMSAHDMAHRFSKEQLELVRAVFLGNSQPLQALRVVQAQRLMEPENLELAQLQAQLAEWGGDPAKALALWRELMKAGLGDKALDAVFRLGPMLGDDETLLVAWRARARQRALGPQELTQVIEVYEHMGRPEGALPWLDEADSRQGVASLRAALLERMGRWDESRKVLEQASARGERLERDDAMRLARVLARQGRFDEAVQSLLAWAGVDGRQTSVNLGVLEQDAEALDYLGDLAWESGRASVAFASYQRLWQIEKLKSTMAIREYQIERILRHLLANQQMQQANEMAAEVYQRIRSNTVVFLWMDSLQPRSGEKRDVAALKQRVQQWKRQLDAKHLAALERDPPFLARRGALNTQIGDMNAAMSDYRASLAVARQPDVETSYWWLLIDQGEHERLRVEVLPRLASVRHLPAYQEVLGASFVVFAEPLRASEFYQRQARERSRDYLWLANYADVLDQVGKNQLAARVRQHAFGLLNVELRRMKAMDREQAMNALLVRLRLSEAYASGAEKERLTRFLAAAWRRGELTAPQAQQYDDLVVSWALAGERHELARQWLLRQRVLKATALGTPTVTLASLEKTQGEPARPDTQGELAYALATRDKPVLQELLNAADAGRFKMHAYDRLNAYRVLGRTEDAVSLAVQLAQRAGEGGLHENEHEVMENDLLKIASRISGTWENKNTGGVLSQRGWDWRASMALHDGWRIQARQADMTQQTRNTAVLADVPAKNRVSMVGVSREKDRTQWQAQLTQNSSLATISGLLLRLSHALDTRRNIIVELGLRQNTDESAALAAAGVVDRLSLQWTQQLAKDVSVDARWVGKRFATQNRVPLGSGQDYSAYVTWQLHAQRPAVQARIGVRRSLQKINTQADPSATFMNPAGVAPDGRFFLAPSGTALSMSLGYNLPEAIDAQGAYSRALRPWAEVGVEQSRSGGLSSSTGVLRAGVRGTVLGRDQLVMGLDIRPQRSGGTSRAAQVQYEWIGDR